MLRIHLAILLPVALAMTHASAHPPRLFFSPDQAEELLRRADLDEHQATWSDIVDRAESFIDPRDRYFRDPEKVENLVAARGDLRSRMLDSGRHLAIWGETLGPVGWIKQRREMITHGAALTVAMASAWPFDQERAAQVDILAHGELMRGLALGYDFFNDAMTAAERTAVAEAGAAYIRDFLKQAPQAWWYPNSNHLVVAAGAAGLLAIAIEETFPEEAPGWIDRCRELVEIWMQSSFDEEGAYSEGASYIEYSNVNISLLSHALERRGDPDFYRHPHIARSPRFLAMSLVPGTYLTEARNSASFAPHFASPWIKRLALVNQDGLAAWLWEKRQGSSDYPIVQLDHSASRGLSFFRILWHLEIAPTPPEDILPLDQLFAGRGLAIWRTGWSENDVMFTIEAGPFYNVTHDQSDEGHFNLYGYGHRWATDPGQGNQFLDHDRSQAIAHSLVFVDGKAQAKSGSGRGTDGQILDYFESAAHSYALADATEAYNRRVEAEERERVPGKGPDHLAAVVRHAHRHALFIRPSHSALPYAVVIDDIQKDDVAREYTWQMVTYEEMKADFRPGVAVVAPGDESGARLHLYLDSVAQIDWESARHRFPDNRQPPTIQQIRGTTRAVNPLFMAVIIPAPAETDLPQVAFDRENQRILVSWTDRTDIIRWAGHRQRPRVEIVAR